MFKFCLLAGSLALAGCTAVEPAAIRAGRDPADPRVRVPAVQYAPVLRDYAPNRPVEPGDWRSLNRRVAPPGALPPE